MKSDTVRNAIEAHGWIGIIISVPLFLIFWAGSVTFFYPEVQRWAAMPHFPLKANQELVSLNQVVNERIAAVSFDERRSLSIRLPNDHNPYMTLRIPVHNEIKPTTDSEAFLSPEEQTNKQQLEDKPVNSNEFKSYILNPQSGEVQAEEEPFQLAQFMNELHYTLHMPGGDYLVGVATLFFLIIILTGIVIQLKKMIKDFFLYRYNQPARNKMKDIHNIVGVTSLPYAFMYALTGLIFNLHILLEIPFLFLVFDGDQKKMVDTLGFGQVQQTSANINYEMPNINKLIEIAEQEKNITVQSINIQNYGDQNAIIGFNGAINSAYAQNITANYQVSSQSFPAELNRDQALFSYGIASMLALHEANYAGLDLRFIYFILGIAFCGMIVAGNILWIAKRQKQNHYPRTLAIVRGITLGGTMGVILATAVAFLIERTLAAELLERHIYVEATFALTLLIAIVAAFFNVNYRKYIAYTAILTSIVLVTVIMADWVLFFDELLILFNNGFTQPIGVNIAFIIMSTLFLWLGIKLFSFDKAKYTHNQNS